MATDERFTAINSNEAHVSSMAPIYTGVLCCVFSRVAIALQRTSTEKSVLLTSCLDLSFRRSAVEFPLPGAGDAPLPAGPVYKVLKGSHRR